MVFFRENSGFSSMCKYDVVTSDANMHLNKTQNDLKKLDAYTLKLHIPCILKTITDIQYIVNGDTYEVSSNKDLIDKLCATMNELILRKQFIEGRIWYIETACNLFGDKFMCDDNGPSVNGIYLGL